MSDAAPAARSVSPPVGVRSTAVFVTRHDRVEFVNPAAARLLAAPADRLVGRSTGELFADDSHREVVAQVGRLPPEHGLTGPVVGRLARADGTSSRVEVTAAALAADRGPGILWFLRDLDAPADERRRATEAALAASQQRLQAILDTATDAIITIDEAGVIELVNPATERIFGYPAAELVGRNVSELMPRSYAAEHDGYIARYLRTGQPRIIGIGREVTGRRRDGTAFPIELAVTEIPGPPRRFTGFVRDITDRKQLEARFLRAQRLESLGALASGVAHDLNNVLTPVLMAVKLLLKDKPGGTRQAILETALASVERGTGIIRQLLAFGGGVPGEKAAVAAGDVVREVAGMMEHTLPKSITLTADAPGDLWPLDGDATQLAQLLVNLCVNARDAMPAGGHIRIAAENFVVTAPYAAHHPGAKPGQYVLLSVADTGTGIPPDVQERMFDPFFTTKPFGQGTGLGLATVQGIVKAHGGFVTVYSEVGRGAKFLVHLPAAAAAAAPPPAEVERAAARPGQGRLVLVVDDEPAVRLMARATLEDAGYRVADAGDGEAALAAYRAGEVAAVVLDMMMPGPDTPTVIRRLRQLDPAARILAVSGLHPSGPTAAVLKEFAVPFLGKPYTDDALLAALDRLHHSAG